MSKNDPRNTHKTNFTAKDQNDVPELQGKAQTGNKKAGRI